MMRPLTQAESSAGSELRVHSSPIPSYFCWMSHLRDWKLTCLSASGSTWLAGLGKVAAPLSLRATKSVRTGQVLQFGASNGQTE